MIPGSLNTMLMGSPNGSLVLDIVPNALVAYSCARKLRSDYTGFCLQVRGQNGSTYQKAGVNIGFLTNNEVDTAAILSYQSSGTPTAGLHVPVCFNQAGSGVSDANNLSASPALVPQIGFTIGSLYLENGKLATFFNGMNWQFSPTQTLASEYTIFCVQRKTGAYGALVSSINGTPTTSNAGLSVWNDGNTYVLDGSGVDTIVNAGTSLQVLAAYKSGSNRELEINGTLQTSTPTAGTRNNVLNSIGIQRNGGSNVNTTGFICEVIVYNRLLSSSEIAFVTQDLKAFWSIP